MSKLKRSELSFGATYIVSDESKKIKNLYYTGQLTIPGPGVPPSLISGEVVANLICKQFNK